MMMRLINYLVTNQYLVRLSHVLCRLWNTVTLPLPGSRRRGRENRSALAAFPPPAGHIQGQGMGAVARLPYGKFTMDYNGCEVIATYNALLTLGAPMPLGEIAAWYERRGLFLAGRWGTHVLAVPRFFRAQGFPVRTVFARHRQDGSAFDAAFAGAPAAIFSFWNSAGKLTLGVHTVALSHGPGGRLEIDNLYGLDREPNRRYTSISEMIRGTGILPILLVTIDRKGL